MTLVPKTADHPMPGRPYTPSKADKLSAQQSCDRVWATQQAQSERDHRENDIVTALQHGAHLPNRVVLTPFEASYMCQRVGIGLKPSATLADAVLSLAFRGSNWRVK